MDRENLSFNLGIKAGMKISKIRCQSFDCALKGTESLSLHFVRARGMKRTIRIGSGGSDTWTCPKMIINMENKNDLFIMVHTEEGKDYTDYWKLILDVEWSCQPMGVDDSPIFAEETDPISRPVGILALLVFLFALIKG